MVQRQRPAPSGFDEWVAGGCRPTGFAETQLAAAGDLRISRRLLGQHGYDLLGRVCGDGFHIRDLYANRRERDAMTHMLRVYLSELARIWH